MTRLLRSEWLRARSRRIVAVLAIGGALGIVVGMAIGISQSSNSFQLDRFIPALEGTASLLGLMTAVVGASLFGADWSSGTMGTLLTWESRRGRILAARGAVVSAVVLGLAVGLQALFALAWWIATIMRGSTLGYEGWIGDVAEAVVRVSLIGAVLALVTGGFALIARSTAGGMIGLLLSVVLIDWFARAFWPEAAAVGLIQNAIVFVSEAPVLIFDSVGNEIVTVTPGRAAVTLTMWVAVALAAGAVSFFRRDVT